MNQTHTWIRSIHKIYKTKMSSWYSYLELILKSFPVLSDDSKESCKEKNEREIVWWGNRKFREINIVFAHCFLSVRRAYWSCKSNFEPSYNTRTRRITMCSMRRFSPIGIAIAEFSTSRDVIIASSVELRVRRARMAAKDLMKSAIFWQRVSLHSWT